MKKKLSTLLCMLSAALLLAGTASAIVVDGDLDDWGFTYSPYRGFHDYEGADNELTGYTNGIWWWEEDGVGYRGYLGPGYGGQGLDVEGLYAYKDATDFYFAVISGIGSDTSPGYYQPGDIIIYAGANTYAVETTGYGYTINGSGYANGTYPSGTQGDLYEIVNGTTLISGLLIWGGAQDPTQIGEIDSGYTPTNISFYSWNLTGEHFAMEGVIPLSLLGDFMGPISFHFATACGNDGGTTPIPEPATMLLLGVGLIGIAGVGRKRFLKKA